MQEGIVKSLQKGEKESFRTIFDSLYPGMCLFARKFVQNSEDAEDICQEVFVELWNQRSRFENNDHIKAFLYLSIKNRCINFLKHKLVKANYEQSASCDAEISFEDNVIEAEVVQQLHNAIKNLPEQQQQVILLNMQGFKNEEIAEEMQLSINTVKLYKKLAYEQLRNKVSKALAMLLFV